MHVRRLLRMELTVSDLAASEQFYTGSLGFTVAERGWVEPALAALLGAKAIRHVTLRRGGQTVALHAFLPPGALYPLRHSSSDQSFQHFALPVENARSQAIGLPLEAPSISEGGAQRLPSRSGGAIAFKFRDPEGHPLELIQFPDHARGGIDHSAIVVADAERSIAFYRDRLGLRLGSRQVNTGPEQDRLDGLVGALVEVVALEPEVATPHVELLAYRSPPVVPAPLWHARDVVGTRLVFDVEDLPDPATTLADGARAALIEDPDGHKLLLLQRP